MRISLLTISIALLPTLARADLRVGDPAPPLVITEWVRGEAVTVPDSADDPVLVLDFWATWCGPCIASIPHLDEIQAKYKDKVAIIGVTRPDPNNALEKVKDFVKARPDTMQYRVAWDADRVTWDGYMKAAGQTGIPTAFIINREGRVAWIGHPMAMDRALEEIVAGKFDIELAGIRQSISSLASKRLRAGDTEAALRLFESLATLDPSDASPLLTATSIALTRAPDKAPKLAERAAAAARDDPTLLGRLVTMLVQREPTEGFRSLVLESAKRHVEIAPDAPTAHFNLARALASGDDAERVTKHLERAAVLAKDDASFLNTMAWTLLTEDVFGGRHDELGLRAAKRASELTNNENASILDTLALAFFENGSKEEAIRTQQTAIEKARERKAPARVIAEFEERLAKFRAEEGEKAPRDGEGGDEEDAGSAPDESASSRGARSETAATLAHAGKAA
ncbi:MAG TPA: redoxin family protein [Planctomycetota bacterium]|nr:redoxin family protein [Planctomycetota bacterium]